MLLKKAKDGALAALRMQHSSMNGPIVLVVIVVVLLVMWVCWRAASEQTKYRVHAWFKYVDRARRGRLGAAAKIVTSVRTHVPTKRCITAPCAPCSASAHLRSNEARTVTALKMVTARKW